MSKKITVEDIFDITLEDIKEFRKELDRIEMRCKKLKEHGINIEGKTLDELLALIKENNG